MARALGAAAILVVTLAGALHSWWPTLGLQRDQITSSPGLEPLYGRADIPLGPGQRLCIGPITLDRATAVARMKITAPVARPGPFRLAVAGAGGYRSVSAPATVPGARVLQPIAFRIAPPPRTLSARACLRNTDARPIKVLATNEPPSQTTADTTVDGRPASGDDATLLLLEARPSSMRARAGTVVARMTAFAGGWLAPSLLWLVLAAMLVLGLAAMLAAFAAGDRREG